MCQKPEKKFDEAEASSKPYHSKKVEVEQTPALEAELRDAAAELLESEAPEQQESNHNATTHTEERSSDQPGETLEESVLEEDAFGKTAVEVNVVLGNGTQVRYRSPVGRLGVLISSEGLGLQASSTGVCYHTRSWEEDAKESSQPRSWHR